MMRKVYKNMNKIQDRNAQVIPQQEPGFKWA